MSNKLFDIIRFISEGLIPALVVLLGVIFANVPCDHSEAIIAIVGAIGVFLASCLGYWRKQYEGGDAE